MARGLSQEDLAILQGTTLAWIRQVEDDRSGQWTPLDELERILHGLHQRLMLVVTPE